MSDRQLNAAVDRWSNEVHQGDAFDVLAELPDDSVHAVVTDPPYGLAFMGRDWDDFEPKEYQEWCEEWAREAKRVLKPGGHLLAFSGNRTHHRLFSGVEDAGLEIRDTITWHYGTGFPKAMDISKAIDKQAGAEDDREVVQTRKDSSIAGGNVAAADAKDTDESVEYEITEPATDAAEKWDGFKTQLKPATEFVVVAQKPINEGTIAENVLEHGTGALNIDECRIGTEGRPDRKQLSRSGETNTKYGDGFSSPTKTGKATGTTTEGRYPANVLFGEQAAEQLDASEGQKKPGAWTPESSTGRNTSDAPTHGDPPERCETDSGGPSRYFYGSKATRAERTLNGQIDNAHPTVKPLDLMEWLVTLVTAEGQVVLDPFAGTGTTCKAAKDLGREFIGIEQQAKWADVARVRCGLDAEDPSHIRGDDAQAGLEAFVATDGGQVDG